MAVVAPSPPAADEEPAWDSESDDSDSPAPPRAAVAAVAAAASFRIFNYTGNRIADEATTRERHQRGLCFRCIPGLNEPHPHGRCPLHVPGSQRPSIRAYPA